MTRQDVYKLIDKERDYQSKWPAEFDDKNTPNDWVAYISHYLGKAVTLPWDRQAFRKAIIKITALGVAILERENYASRHYDGTEQL